MTTKRKEPVPEIRTERIWRDDATIYPDGTREGGWVTLRVYQAERVPETRDGFTATSKGQQPIRTQEGVERLADLWARIMEQDVVDGKGIEKGKEVPNDSKNTISKS